MHFIAATLLTLGCACSTRSAAPTPTPTQPPRGVDLPVLHGAAVHGPFQDEAALCRAVYAGQADCLKRPSQQVAGPTSAATAGGFAHVEIVDAGLDNDRCAIVFQIADRLYVQDHPGLCLHEGYSFYMPKVREIGFRDLDRMGTKELVIIADVEVGYDAADGAPPQTTAPVRPVAMAIVCGQRRGGTPSCVVATTNAPEDFVVTHNFRF